jgi:CheY-like chemotaxis protein
VAQLFTFPFQNQIDASMSTGLGNILLVEDDPHGVELMLAAFAEQNMANRVVVVRDGAEALDYLFRRGKFKNRVSDDPIVVLLDNKMPKVNGLEVLKIIRADKNLKLIPVVALTSSGATRDVVEFYKHGANAYVVKPMGFLDLQETVRQLGIFWWSINVPPPHRSQNEALIQSREVICAENKKIKDSPFHTAALG